VKISKIVDRLLPAYPERQERITNARVEEDLVREALTLHGKFRLRARGGSMNPAIPDNELVEVVPVSVTELRVGDVVMSVHKTQCYVIHRIVWKDRTTGTIRTKGDSLDGLDPRVGEAELLGRVRWYTALGKSVSLDHGLMGAGGSVLAALSLTSLMVAGISRKLFLRLPGGIRIARFLSRVSRVPGWVLAWILIRLAVRGTVQQYSGPNRCHNDDHST